MSVADIEILALTSDAQLLHALEEAAHGHHRWHHAASAEEAAQLAAGNLVGVLVTDAPLDQLEDIIAPIELGAPGLVTVVVGDRDHGNELLELNNSGPIFRFLLKPVSTGQLRLYMEAAAKHHVELVSRGPQPLVLGVPKAPAPRPRRRLGLLVPGAVAVLAALGASALLSRPGEMGVASQSQRAPQPDATKMEALSLLVQARRAEQEGHLVDPPEHSALDLYARALALEPDELDASQALARIADTMFQRAEAALAQGDVDGARADVTAAKRALPGHPRLAYFATRLEMEEQRKIIAQALQAAGTGAMNEAAGLIDEAAQVRLGESGAVTEARAELARREETHGRIESLLEQAQACIAAGQLTEPAAENALSYLNAARQAGARAAILAPTAQALAAAMVARGAAATHLWDLQSAEAWLEHARELAPEIDSLAAAQIELAAASARAERAEQWTALARERLAQGDLITPVDDNAAYFLGLLRADTPDYPTLATALAELAQSLQHVARVAIDTQDFDRARQALDAIGKLGVQPPGLAQSEQAYADARAAAEAAAAQARANTFATLVRRKYVPPEYPQSAERRQIEGRVELALTVDPSGKVSHVEVTDAKPRDVFDRAAIAAVERWEYQPAEVDGKAVEARTLVAIDFNLE